MRTWPWSGKPCLSYRERAILPLAWILSLDQTAIQIFSTFQNQFFLMVCLIHRNCPTFSPAYPFLYFYRLFQESYWPVWREIGQIRLEFFHFSPMKSPCRKQRSHSVICDRRFAIQNRQMIATCHQYQQPCKVQQMPMSQIETDSAWYRSDIVWVHFRRFYQAGSEVNTTRSNIFIISKPILILSPFFIK